MFKRRKQKKLEKEAKKAELAQYDQVQNDFLAQLRGNIKEQIVEKTIAEVPDSGQNRMSSPEHESSPDVLESSPEAPVEKVDRQVIKEVIDEEEFDDNFDSSGPEEDYEIAVKKVEEQS